MIEAQCGKCGGSFVPADEDDLEHVETAEGAPCGGQGVIVRIYQQS